MRPSRFTVLLPLILIMGAVLAQSQDQCTLSLKGRVMDNHDGEPLEFANILILGTDHGTTTDLNGDFILENLCPGTYEVRFSHIGCETKTRVITIDGNKEIMLRLEHHAELLETIQLTAERINTAGSVSRESLTTEQLSQVQGQSLGETMRQLPGVTAIQTGPAIFKPVIHGLHSNRILIINNGVRQESQQWGFDHAPEIDPFLANTISVIKGTAAVQYGADAVAGVIVVEPDTLPSDDSFGGRIGLHGMSNGYQGGLSALVEKGFHSGLGLRAHATIKRSGDKHAPDYNLTNTGFSELNSSLAIGFRRGLNHIDLSYNLFSTEIGILRSAHIGNLTDLEEAIARGEPFIVEPFSYEINNPRQKVLHHTLNLKGQKYFENFGILSGLYALQWNNRQEFDVRRGDRDDIPALDLQLASQTGMLQFAHEEVIGLRGRIGLHWNYRRNSNEPGTGVRPLIPNYNSYLPGVSIIEKWIGRKIEVEAGLRYEYQVLKVKRFDDNNVLQSPEFDYHNFSTSAGLRWNVKDALDLTANLGTTQRAPTVNELFSEGLHHGAAAIEEGDTSLVPEKALKLILGIELQKERMRGQVSFYMQSIRDFIYLRPEGEPRLTVRGAFPVFKYVQNDAFLWGLDAAFEYDIVRGHLSANVKYSFVRADNLDEDQPLIYMPSDRLRLGVDWHCKLAPIRAGFGVSHVFEQTRFPDGLDYSDPPPAYTLADFYAGYKIQFNGSTLDISLGVNNLFNASYREYLNRLRYFADDVGRNFELRINYTF